MILVACPSTRARSSHRSRPVLPGGDSLATHPSRRSRRWRRPVHRSENPLAEAPVGRLARGRFGAEAPSRRRAGVVQVRSLPRVRRPDHLRRPAPQPLPALPLLPARRRPTAGRSGEPVPLPDGAGRHLPPSERRAGPPAPLSRVWAGAPLPRRSGRQRPRLPTPTACAAERREGSEAGRRPGRYRRGDRLTKRRPGGEAGRRRGQRYPALKCRAQPTKPLRG